MCKVILREKDTNEIIFSKQFADEGKAEGLKAVFEKYINPAKAEVLIEKKETQKHRVKRKQKGVDYDN